jgi:hypothetical protein
MKTYAEMKQFPLRAWPAHESRTGPGQILRGVEVDWYQVAVVTITCLAILTDLVFPPVRVAIGNGLDIYAGHSFQPLPASGEVTVDVTMLVVEILMIIVAAVASWRIGTPKDR